MKKPNKIDDLFARKLSNLERTPSPNLWQRIEQGQKKESRRLGDWYWYAAASVTILLMAGYLVWQNQTQTVEPRGQMAQTEQLAEPKEEKLESPASELNEKEALAGKQKAEPVQGNDQHQFVKRGTYTAVEKAATPIQQQIDRMPILEDVKIAKVEKTETNPEQLIAKNNEVRSLPSVEVQVPGTGLADLLPNRVIVAHVETEDINREDQKLSKFLRVMRQLKNAKQGDEVEWDELGFNPKRILARADERLRNGEDKISDKYQELKNKTKL